MPANSTQTPRSLPIWLKVCGSVVAMGHLLCIGICALAARSGPWMTPHGIPSHYDGPQFATAIGDNFIFPYYLEPLHMTNHYHFDSNRATDFAVFFEIHLKDQAGIVKTLKFPDEKANFWVRHRQGILAQNLAHDQRVPPRTGRKLDAPPQADDKPAEDAKSKEVDVWVRDGDFVIRLESRDEYDKIFENPQMEQPSPWTKALAQSYLRYLCREHNAVSAELVRHSRPTVVPMDLLAPRADAFNVLKSYFGEFRRDK